MLTGFFPEVLFSPLCVPLQQESGYGVITAAFRLGRCGFQFQLLLAVSFGLPNLIAIINKFYRMLGTSVCRVD